MLGKFYHPIDESGYFPAKNGVASGWRIKKASKMQKKQLQKRIFGEHYNFGRVEINKQKKNLIQEQKNTQIERSNRILLEKIQRIAHRSVPAKLRKRNFTEEGEPTYNERQPAYNEKQFKELTYKDRQFSYKHELERFMAKNEERLRANVLHSSDVNISRGSHSRLTKMQGRLVIFKGRKEIDGHPLNVSIFIDHDKYHLVAEHNRSQHKINMSLSNYQRLLSQYLQGKHLNIFTILRFQHNILEMEGLEKNQQQTHPANHKQQQGREIQRKLVERDKVEKVERVERADREEKRIKRREVENNRYQTVQHQTEEVNPQEPDLCCS